MPFSKYLEQSKISPVLGIKFKLWKVHFVESKTSAVIVDAIINSVKFYFKKILFTFIEVTI